MSITQRSLRVTGLGTLVSFYRYFAFNLPRFTTASAVALMLGFATIHMWLLFADYEVPAYLTAYLALLVTGSLLTAAGLLTAWVAGARGAAERHSRTAPHHPAARRGRGPGRGLPWLLGSVVSLADIGVYLFSRTGGLPGLPELVGRWDFVLGTVSMGLAGAFLGLHFSVLTGLNVAAPDRRDWHH